ncbi:MAG TPA: TerC family protein [Methylomusa anaerophila]|uniref:Inner membrane protein alx n=1 Tax=Methylomusa anaerophila TaxID=1930071 RepID=A0A348AK65_9FIRM|nr:TerC family protein [Methylomusa anaerophila]BBB91463.1 inner membrane protein alx [Methylomusa anaerophila]HML89947.1 TerC family protein [Methylomusa anaerophila]
MSELVTGVISNYAQFFSFQAFWDVVSNPLNLAIIGTLIILEGLLSADNALVLAIMVKHLPQNQQKKALFYGIFGAYLFRFIAIGLGTYLIKIWWIKAVGALYLLWLSFQYFALKKSDKEDDPLEEKTSAMGFWRTVLAVELMDIAFSMDSVLAAIGVSDQVWVLYLGGILGVMMMRGVAQLFLMLIEKYPGLETTAYVLIGIIGTKMMASAFGYHTSNVVFFGTLVIVFFSTFVIHHLRGENA